MPLPSIVFSCPACGAKLTLPSDLAGITGPCPACRKTIQAPTHDALQAQTLLAQAAPPVPPAAASSPPAGPARSQPIDDPIESGAQARRHDPAASMAKEDSEATSSRRVRSTYPPQRRTARRSVMPALFLVALVAVVGGIVQVIRYGADSTKSRGASPTAGDSRLKRILPDPLPPPAAGQPTATGGEASAATAPPATSADAVRPGARALKTLAEFLTADTLAERRPLIETNTPPEELAKSCLAGKLPHTSIEATVQTAHDTGSITDCFYRVGFDLGDGKEYLQTVLVQIRGAGPPAVVVDPLLDLYGGRLASYAATPTDKPGYFHVILCALSRPPDNWPNADNKFIIKLQSDEQADHSIAVAVADKLSGIGKALTDSVITGLNWDLPKPCLVMLQWNLENPTKPYLEALEAKRLDWEP